MTTTTPQTGLDAIQLAALRKCDTVSFHHHNGQSYIRACKRIEPSARDPFAVDQDVTIACETHWTDYSRECGMSYPVPSFAGFASLGNYDDSEWRTTAQMLRKGDELILRWQRDAGTTNALRDDSNGFHLDRVSLIVIRGKETWRFHLQATICQDNTARMIRDVRKQEYSLA
jgi:hypothetical protein